MVPLVCGNPSHGPASYTRFIMPFAYKLEECSTKGFPAIFRPSAPINVWRKRYLTVETAAMLFHRAKWLELKGLEENLDFQISRDGRNLTVHMAAPRLVLFEWPTASQVGNEDKSIDPLSIGFLIVDTSFLEQDEAPGLDDLLEFNEKFRYWQQPYKEHEAEYRSFLAKCPLNLFQRQPLVGNGDLQAIYFERWASLLEIPIEGENGKRWQLFPEAWQQEARNWVSEEHKHQGARDSGWVVYTDNRTFVWTSAIIQGGGKTLQTLYLPGSPIDASSFGHWIKLLNVDSPGASPEETHKSTQFERDWARERTYHRWEDAGDGTFYGFNYHAGAMLGSASGKVPVGQHFGEMYFDQTLLLLYLRVTSFSFSHQLSRISEEARDSRGRFKPKEKWLAEFQKLRWSFALFTNLYEFPLLSNQQQGIEMYELARKHMDVEKLFREIQDEIQSSHDYLQIEAGQEQTEITTRLTVVATGGLILGLTFSFFGMEIIIGEFKQGALGSQMLWLSVGIVVCLLLVAIFIRLSKWFTKSSRRLANWSPLSWLKRKKRGT